MGLKQRESAVSIKFQQRKSVNSLHLERILVTVNLICICKFEQKILSKKISDFCNISTEKINEFRPIPVKKKTTTTVISVKIHQGNSETSVNILTKNRCGF